MTVAANAPHSAAANAGPRDGRCVVPGDAVLHPIALAAIGLLLVNDHVLKGLWPGWWTGKISDFAGLIFFPLLLQGLWEVGTARRGGLSLSLTPLVVAVAASGLAFAAIEVWALAADVAAQAGGIAQWPVRAVEAAVRGSPLPGVHAVALTADITDLIALVALAAPLVLGWRRVRRRDSVSGTTEVAAAGAVPR